MHSSQDKPVENGGSLAKWGEGKHVFQIYQFGSFITFLLFIQINRPNSTNFDKNVFLWHHRSHHIKNL
jgi:hypothetical protein